MPHTVLVTDDDASIHELIRRAIEPTGARVLDAYDGEEALEHLASRPIDLLLTDVMMPGMDGLALVRTLRETANKNFPVVVITSMDDSVRESLAHYLDFSEKGQDEFVHKPFSVAALSTLLTGILARLQPFDEITVRQSLEGTLSTLSFLDVLQLLQNARLTGTLEFDEPEPGKLFFQDGEVIDAQCSGVKGRKAFYRMLAWTKGAFRFMKKSSLRAERRIDSETTVLVMGGLAFLDEHRKLLAQVPAALSVAVRPETFRSPLSENERELLALVLEKAATAAILDASEREDLPVLRDLKALLDRGLLTPAEGAEPAGD